MIYGVSTLFTYNALVLLVFILGWSFYAFRKKNYSLLEIGWPLSLVFVVWTSFLLFGAQSIYRRLLVLTVTIWGLRLAFHLYRLFWNKPESGRYRRLREAWEGKLSGLKAVLVLVVVPLLVYYVVSMILSIGFLDSQEMLHWWQYLGVALWALGMLFEIGAEVQLERFLAKPENEGQMLTKGLWRISRHPHYFGTAIVWWGIYLISIVDWNNLLGILSPIMMTLFATYLASRSGSEIKYQEREDLQDYTRKTSQFLPFSAQIGRGLSSIGRGLGKALSKMGKASAGAVSSAAQKAKTSRKKENQEVEATDNTNPYLAADDELDAVNFRADLPSETVVETDIEAEIEEMEAEALFESEEEAFETDTEFSDSEFEEQDISTEELVDAMVLDDAIIIADDSEEVAADFTADAEDVLADELEEDIVAVELVEESEEEDKTDN